MITAAYPTHEVWGGYSHNGECDDPRHLEDCFSRHEAEAAALEWASGKDRYAFVRAKDDISPALPSDHRGGGA